jgi:signal transduction histidine kinase
VDGEIARGGVVRYNFSRVLISRRRLLQPGTVRQPVQLLSGELSSDYRRNDRLLALRNQCVGPAAFLRRVVVRSLPELAAVLLFLLPAARADDSATLPPSARHILLLYSDNTRVPFSLQQDEVFRETLTRLYPGVVIFSENLDWNLIPENAPTDLAADFYRQKYKSVHFDAIIAIKPSALAFLLAHRRDTFAGAPVVFCNVGSRDKLLFQLTPGVVGVTIDYSLLPRLALMRQMQPEIRRVAVVIGVSSAETAFLELSRKETALLAGDIPVDYWVGFPPEELKARLAGLTRETAVLYVSEWKDTEGRTFVSRDLLEEIVPAAKVPIYSLATTNLGTGSVGGRLIDPTTDARMAVDLVRRIVNGEKPETLVSVNEPATYAFDARALERFAIPLSRLPAGSQVLFHEPSMWQKYKWYLLAGLLAVLFESLFLGRLALEARRRRKSEAMLKDLSARLMDAQEKERRRIARELHDDLNQRLVLLVSHLEDLETAGRPSQLATIAEEAREISLGVNRLSHQLHSSALDILGLEPALRGLARDISRVHGLPVHFSSEEDLHDISPDVKLCLFRVAQEALSNVVKHSGASHAEVHLVGANGRKSITMTVTDDGKGFDPDKVETDSLGIISMRERLRLVGGELRILPRRPAGTRVEVSVPSPEVNGEGAASAP